MGASSGTVVDQLRTQADEFRANATELQAYAFAQGQNLAQKAALEAQSGAMVGGNLETPESYLVRQQGELEAQKERQKYQGAMDYTALSYDIAKEVATTTRQQFEIANKIQKDKSVSLFSDPALAIANAFTLPWDQQNLEGTTAKLDELNKAKATLDTTLQQHARSTELVKTSLTDASILSTTKALSNIQKIKEIDATNEALRTDAQGIRDVMHAKAQATDAQMKILQVQDHEESMALRREQFAELKASREARLEALKENTDKKKSAIQYVNAARARDGLPALDDLTVLNGLSQPKGSKAGEQFGNWYDRGIAMTSGVPISDGETAQERLSYWSSTGIRPKNTRQETLVQLTAEAVKKANSENKDKGAAAVAADKIVEDKIKQWKANIVPGDTSNPFQPPSYDAISSMEGLKDLKAYPVIASLVTDANKNLPIDQQQVFDTLTAAVLKRDITGNDAAIAMSQLYKKTTLLVNMQADTIKYTGRAFKEWNATINTGNIVLGGTEATAARFLPLGKTTFDLTDEVKVQHQIQKAIVNKLGTSINWAGEYPDIPGGGGFYPPILKSGVVAPTK